MKPLYVSEDVIPVGTLKTQAARILKKLRTDGRPILVTSHGRPAAVLLTPEDFDAIAERDRVVAAIQEGLADVRAGRMIEHDDLMAELRREFGPPEDDE